MSVTGLPELSRSQISKNEDIPEGE